MLLADFKARWPGEAGYRQLLKVAFPLIVSSGSTSLMLFIDRMLLSWYSNEAIAATLPAGLLHWTLICPFFGMAMYTSTFVAQYTGANRPERVGASIWQGLYLCIIGSLALPAISPLADEFFALVGHAPRIQEMESSYFKILSFCSFFFLTNAVLSSFYSGRGRAWTIVWINFLAMFLNTVFDYALIFGNWGFPELGIVGAGYATLASSAVASIIYFFLVLSRHNDAAYATKSSWKLEVNLIRRMVKYGFPAGIHFFLDVIGFTIFIMLIGRLGIADSAATNIAHQIHLLGLLPLVGLGIANTILVGQYQGGKQSHLAEKATYSSIHLATAYNLVAASCYLFLPLLFIGPFFLARQEPPSEELLQIITNLLKFVALFTFFDALVILTSGTLKGAGDTKFVMRILTVTSVTLVIIPTILIIEVYRLPLYYAWSILAVNQISLSVIFSLRFRSGKWKDNQVIE
ncbi:MATE family efflux transporter [Pelagicoccus sp. SDUM812002]|uniref:MATE family efflux transporter n=1 Tax=Pelagicoccus sp. SDUM812002 TaxID=3041266 RepID=UPI00280E54DE|nr:MATE family efflux transporter [Pelagicoccus sp. SDUM812002]MDQ8187831.1 MATE family efflux transporter [Pelagicoccus sp. SDUM812002]